MFESPRRRKTGGRPGPILLLAAGLCAGCRAAGPEVPPTPISTRPGTVEAPKRADAPRDEVLRAKADEEAAIPPKPTRSGDPDGSPAPKTLEEAIAFALAHNPRLRQAEARTVAAGEDREIAFAPFLPEINFSNVFAGYNIPILPGGAFVPTSLRGGVYAYNLAEAGIQYTIYDFGRRAGNYDRASSRARYESLMLDRARQTVAFEVASAYFRLLASRAEVRVREESDRRARVIREDAEARLKGGTTEKEIVLRSEVEVARTSEELVATRQAVLDAEALLNLAMGQPCGPLPMADVPRRPPYTGTLEQALDRAAASRPEIGAAREEIAGARAGQAVAHADRAPKVYVRGAVLRADSPKILHTWVDGAGAHIEQPLYAGGKRLAAERRAAAEAEGSMAGLRRILNDLSAEVNIAHNAIATDRERIRLSASAAVQARENLRIVVIRYNNGDAIPSEVVDAQTALTSAEVRYYAASYGYLDDLARLEYAQGGTQSGLLEAVSAEPKSDDERIGLPPTPREERLEPPPGGLPPALPDEPR